MLGIRTSAWIAHESDVVALRRPWYAIRRPNIDHPAHSGSVLELCVCLPHVDKDQGAGIYLLVSAPSRQPSERARKPGNKAPPEARKP